MSFHNISSQLFSLSAGTFYTTPTVAVGAFVLVGIVVDSGDPMIAPPNIVGPSGVTTLYDAVPDDAPNVRLRIDWMYANATTLSWSIDDVADTLTYNSQRFDDTIVAEFGLGGFIVEPSLTTGNDGSPTTDTITVVCDPVTAALRSVFVTADGSYNSFPTGPPGSWAYSLPHTYPAMFVRNTVNEGSGVYGPVVGGTNSAATWATAIWASAFLTPPAVTPPLRLRQRDDTLGPAGTPRLPRFQTSKQGSTRLRSYE